MFLKKIRVKKKKKEKDNCKNVHMIYISAFFDCSLLSVLLSSARE